MNSCPHRDRQPTRQAMEIWSRLFRRLARAKRCKVKSALPHKLNPLETYKISIIRQSLCNGKLVGKQLGEQKNTNKKIVKSKLLVAMSLIVQLVTPHGMAQCVGGVYVAPTHVSCDCILVGCGSGGAEVSAHNKCDSKNPGSLTCTTTSGVIGVTVTCSTTNHWDLVFNCVFNSGRCAWDCITENWADCIACIAEMATDSSYIACDMVTCTTARSNILGAIYLSETGTCPAATS